MAYGESRISVVGEYMLAWLTANMATLGLEAIFYDDQALIPKTPTLCVVPAGKRRELAGAPVRTNVEYTIYLMLYQEKIQDVQVNFRESMVLAEAVEQFLHTDLSMGGNCQFSMVTGVEPGYAIRSRTLMRCTRLTWEGRTVMVGATIT